MEKRRALFIAVLAAFGIGLHAPAATAQLVIGQYEEEAPVGTWNSYPYINAAALGRGLTAFTLARDASVASGNPALLSFLPKFTIAAGSDFQVAAFDKYGPVNTGVLGTNGNLNLSVFGLDFGGASVRTGGWSLAFAVTVPEVYDRPTAETQSLSGQGNLLQKESYTQSGIRRDFTIALARKLGRRWSIGLGLNIVSGRLDRKWLEQWAGDGGTYQILDHKTRDIRGLYINGGLVYEIPGVALLTAVVRAPFVNKADSRSDLRYDSALGITEISIPDSATDEFHEPAVFGLGASWNALPSFTIAADFAYFDWSKYTATFFGDPDPRDFRNIVKAGVGVEYRPGSTLFGSPASVPVRLGVVYDPQPMNNPRSTYYGFTLGNGLEWKSVRLDLGMLLGWESGSGADLSLKRFALSLAFIL